MATYRKTAKTIKKVLLPPSRRLNVNVTPSWIFKNSNFNGRSAKFNFIKIGQRAAEIRRFNGFQNGGHPPSWICWEHIETTHDDHFVVSIGIAVQNLVEIDAVVCIL